MTQRGNIQRPQKCRSCGGRRFEERGRFEAVQFYDTLQGHKEPLWDAVDWDAVEYHPRTIACAACGLVAYPGPRGG